MEKKTRRKNPYLGERGEAVGGAGGVGDDVVLGGIVLVVVHAHDKHRGVSGGGADDDLLGAAGKVGVALVDRGENTSALTTKSAPS